MSMSANKSLKSPINANTQPASWGPADQKGVDKQQMQSQKRRPGGGWENDGDEPQMFLNAAIPVYGQSNTNNQNNANLSLKQATNLKTEPKAAPEQKIQNRQPTSFGSNAFACDENFLKTHEYESKIIYEIIQPGGARVKQPDSTLNDFCNTCEHLQPNVIGSILLCKFDEPLPWVSKARVLFAIEALSRKFNRYFDFFKHNISVLQKVDFTREGLNANQLRKLMDNLLHVLNQPHFSPELQKENQAFSKPTTPVIVHNNSQETNKPKQDNIPRPVVVKSASLPAPGINPVNDKPNATQVTLNTVNKAAPTLPLPTLKPVGQKTPIREEKIENAQSSQNSSKPSPNNVARHHSDSSPNIKIPLEEVNSITNSLSDIDFSADPNMVSPNNLYDLYRNVSPMNYGASPMNYPPGYMGGYSPAYNYPMNNCPPPQGGFNAYWQAHNMGYPVNPVGPNIPNVNYQAGQPGQPITPQNQEKKEEEDSLFKQVPQIDYDRDEREKQKKRQENEKRFESLSFSLI